MENFIETKPTKGILKVVHIADLHIGAFSPKAQYEILKSQFKEQ